jgi:hypothetical protein
MPYNHRREKGFIADFHVLELLKPKIDLKFGILRA